MRRAEVRSTEELRFGYHPSSAWRAPRRGLNRPRGNARATPGIRASGREESRAAVSRGPRLRSIRKPFPRLDSIASHALRDLLPRYIAEKRARPPAEPHWIAAVLHWRQKAGQFLLLHAIPV